MHSRTAQVFGVLLRGPLGPSDVDPDDIRDLACDTTAPGRVCRPPTTEPPRPSEPSSGGGGGGGWGDLGALGQIFVFGLIALFLALVIWLLVRNFGERRADDEGGDEDDLDEAVDDAVDERVVDHGSPPDRWRRRAAEARSAGDHREAVRCEYRALVGDLARGGHVDEIPGRTSGEERAQITELAPGLGDRGRDVARQFDRAADIFDAAWFDDAPVTATDDERFTAAAEAVLGVLLSSSGRRGRR